MNKNVFPPIDQKFKINLKLHCIVEFYYNTMEILSADEISAI